MTQNEIRERLLELARVRLKGRFGAFEQFRLTLDGLPSGAAILTRAGLMPAPWTVGLKMGLDEAAKQIDLHFLRLIDAWAQDEAPARQIPVLEGLQPLAAEPQAETPRPAPVMADGDAPAKRSNRKPSWATVAMPYMKSLFTAGHYKSASMFYKALMHRAGESDSPFKLVNRELYCTEAGTTVSDGALGNVWPQIRAN